MAAIIGDNCIISPGAVIGSEGFGNARNNKKWSSIAHLGNVFIGNNVSIGANTTIDRGSMSNTEIHDGVKIDNLIHIAHNVIIGEDTAIAAKTGIAGSTKIGKRCMIGGAVGIVGHLNIADDVVINATSTVNRNISKPGIYTGFMPIMLHSEWKKVGMWVSKLDKIASFLKIKLKNIR
jgi:UDP-3-O-[3-hydroxymyristoyl] glucosamine N-acyltransferase